MTHSGCARSTPAKRSQSLNRCMTIRLGVWDSLGVGKSWWRVGRPGCFQCTAWLGKRSTSSSSTLRRFPDTRMQSLLCAYPFSSQSSLQVRAGRNFRKTPLPWRIPCLLQPFTTVKTQITSNGHFLPPVDNLCPSGCRYTRVAYADSLMPSY